MTILVIGNHKIKEFFDYQIKVFRQKTLVQKINHLKLFSLLKTRLAEWKHINISKISDQVFLFFFWVVIIVEKLFNKIKKKEKENISH